MAGDSFFAKDKKRKRLSTGGSAKTPYEKPYRPAMYGKGADGSKAGRRRKDEELTDEGEDDGNGVDLDDMNFRRDDLGDSGAVYDSDGEEADKYESAAAKRVRLAKGYLEKVKGDLAVDDGTFDAADVDRELIASRLQQDVDEITGKIHQFIGSGLVATPPQRFVPSFKAQPLTCSCIATSDLYTANKKGTIVRYSLRDLKMVGQPFGQDLSTKSYNTAESSKAGKGKAKASAESAKGGHKGAILCLAASEDGRYLLSGGRDKMIGVWEVGGKDVEKGSVRWLKALGGHKDAVTSIAIPPLANPSHHFLATSLSRHLTLHSISTLSLIDTFFGHQDATNSVSSLKPTLAVTSGARDRTCRWWKVEEEVQLVFRGGGKTFEKKGEVEEQEPADALSAVNKKQEGKVAKSREFVEGSLDVVCMLDDQHFLSGGDSGSICLWNTGKKKPIFTQALAHGIEESVSESEGVIATARWITSLAALRGTDVFASGSCDGSIRLWRLNNQLKSFSALFNIPAHGFVNSLQFLAVPAGVYEADVTEDTVEDDAVQQPRAKAQPDLLLVAALSKEPRLGRWSRVAGDGTKNGTLIVKLVRGESALE